MLGSHSVVFDSSIFLNKVSAIQHPAGKPWHIFKKATLYQNRIDP
jgi:hypothetical protein